jgi:hypothetical protein
VKVEYRGPHESVEVPLGDGSAIVVRRGESVEIDDSVAAGLLVQSTWRESRAKASEPKPDVAPKQAAKTAGKDKG